MVNKSESISKLAAALVKAQRQMGNATKDAANPFFRSKYADLNSVREAVTPALHEQGISLLQPTVHIDGKNFVRTTLLHESGEFVCSDTEVVVKEAGNPQALGSAISYARRYGLSSLLSVGAEDDDGEGAMGRKQDQKSQQAAPAPAGDKKAAQGNPFVATASFRKKG